MLFLDQLLHAARLHPERPALELLGPDREALDYGRLAELVEAAARRLRAQGVRPGDRVALQLPKGLPFVLLHLGALRLGAISLPLNPTFPPAEVAYFLSDADAALYVTTPEARARLLPELAQRGASARTLFVTGGSDALLALPDDDAPLPPLPADPDATALMIYTSGTTGRPKGAQLSHGNLSANLEALHAAWGWRADDRLLHALPIFHTHGLVVALHGALHAGAHATLLPRFDAGETLALLASGDYSVFMGVPAIHRRLLDAAGDGAIDLSPMRLITSGSDRLPDALFEGFRRTFGVTLLERYGMTETGMNLSNPYRGERRIGSVGLPLPGVEVRIVDPETLTPLPDGEVGELQIRGPHVFGGYWRQPQKTAAAFTPDGWLRSGDLGLRDADGYHHLRGRAKDLIISGGFNVYPPEVERALAEHPVVAAAAAIGCPDDAWGEAVTAVVELRPGDEVSGDTLIAFCRERLAPYKCPKRVVVVDALPRNAMGKVQKGELRAVWCGGAQG
jgi:malonyl-CoA/methylmalonyl-CoA synthetase